MKKLAKQTCIIGLGERSTQYYINSLHKKYHTKYGDFHTFPFVMYQVDFNAINPFLPNQFDKLIPECADLLKTVSDFEASHYLIPNITLHETLDKIEHNLNIVHPIQLTITYCKRQQVNSLVLFGSEYTMNSNYISNALKVEGIEIIIPSKYEQLQIDRFRKKTYNNIDTLLDFNNYNELIQKFTNSHHVLTACTELSLHHPKLDNLKVIDMALLQIDTIVPIV